MSAPAYLNSFFRYKESVAVVDVDTIIADLRDELVTQPAAPSKWTEPVGGTFKSPARADAISYTIQCTKISATRIAYIVKDQWGMLVNNATDTRQDIDVAGSTVHYYTGPFHVCVVTERATPEPWMCGVLDQSPDPLGKPRPLYFASKMPRDNAGTFQTYEYWNSWILVPGATAYANNSSYLIMRSAPNSSVYRETCGGTKVYFPQEFCTVPSLEPAVWLGRIFQCVMLDGRLAAAAEITLPIEGASTGVFKVVGFPNNANFGNVKLAFRKS